MKRAVKKGWGILCGTLLAALLTVGVAARMAPTDLFYVNDYADVISQENETYYLAQGKALEERTKAQIVVATVPSLDGQDLEEYANALFNDWGIGGAQDSNGLLILLAPNEREIRVEVGYGLEGAINDAKAGRFVDNYALSYFQRDEFDEGLYNLYNALLPEIYKEYGLVPPENIRAAEEAAPEQDDNSSLLNLMVMIVALIIVFRFSGPRGPRRMRGLWPMSGGFGGGLSSGGFNSRGGGGGGFSGGGGSSGGGGASRKF